MKTKKLEIDGKTTIKCGKVEITDNGVPFSTGILIDGKDLMEIYSIQKLTYSINVNGRNKGKHKLVLEYYERPKK